MDQIGAVDVVESQEGIVHYGDDVVLSELALLWLLQDLLEITLHILHHYEDVVEGVGHDHIDQLGSEDVLLLFSECLQNLYFSQKLDLILFVFELIGFDEFDGDNFLGFSVLGPDHLPIRSLPQELHCLVLLSDSLELFVKFGNRIVCLLVVLFV